MFAILALVGFSHAQTTSDNIVGYAKVTINSGELALVALNFETSTALVSDIIGDQLPTGSKIFKWNKDTGNYTTINKTGRGGWGSNTLDLGQAFWISPGGTAGTPYEVILNGDVKTDASISSVINSGIEATGLFFPVEVTFGSTDLSAQLAVGSKIHIWDQAEQKYSTYSKTGRGGWGSAASVVVGPTTGFWVQSGSDVNWTESRPFNF